MKVTEQIDAIEASAVNPYLIVESQASGFRPSSMRELAICVLKALSEFAHTMSLVATER